MDRYTIALLALVALAISPAGVVAANNSTASSDSPSAANNSTAASASGDVVKRIDSLGYISDVEWSDGTMTLTVHSDRYRSATVSGTVGGDSGRFAIRDVTLYRGETTISVAAPTVDGAATATIVTGQCKSEGSCPYVQVGSRAGSPFSGGSTLGWLGGAFASIVTFFGVGWFVLRRGDGSPEVA
ncbi:hypothetical protein [Halocalculus aciditolerans]|nr:hypothetical protein [Halocalculus aciditolerans]